MTNQILNGPVFLYIKLSQLAVKTKIYIYIYAYMVQALIVFNYNNTRKDMSV